jgi:hypothetical protein
LYGRLRKTHKAAMQLVSTRNQQPHDETPAGDDMKRLTTTTLALSTMAAFVVAGCGMIEISEDVRPTKEQTVALGGIFGQFAAVAGLMDDPDSANNEDMYTAVEFRPFVKVVDPSCDTDGPAIPSGPPGPLNADGASCVVADPGPNKVEMKDCQVMTPTNSVCVFNLEGSKVESMSPLGTQYDATISLSGPPPCPQLDITISFFMEGTSDAPTAVNGICEFSEDDGDQNVYTGRIEFVEAAMVDGCDELSTGSFIVAIQGLYLGRALNSLVQLFFGDKPCGELSITYPGQSVEPAFTCGT